ncbi:hypothetical protein BVRB_6g145590 [Beta vulgaris subsp. vulgaris]|nr:hypothetical protein BVRB_6g145590 [Beta vulgaris subsp. vulgaris]
MGISSEEMEKKKQLAPKAPRTSKRVRNIKVLSSPIFVFGDNDDDDEPVLIAQEDFSGYVSPSREPSPVPMENTPQTASATLPSPQKSQPPPNSLKSTSSVPKEKGPVVVPIQEEQPAVPNSKEPYNVPDPDFPSSSSHNPIIRSTYTLEHAERLDHLFTLVMGPSEAMMEFAGDAKDVNGLVTGLSDK